MERFRKFIPFVKVDEAKREVYGLVTAELPDKEDEVCDYATTKVYYQEVANEMSKASEGANIMPLREMHQLSAVGKGTELVPNDASKEILMGFKVVDDNAWKKVVQKVYLGFSQGGDYVRKWMQDGLTYYTAKPSEVSLVDNPCLGAARFVIKADGTCQLQKIGGSDVTVSASAAEGGDLYEAVKLMNRAAQKAATVADPVIQEEALRKALVKYGFIKEPKTKRVSGVDLPAHCFASVGDAEKTSTWNFPIEFPGDVEKTQAHLRHTLARFSATKGIPDGEKAQVKSKLVAAAKAQGMEVTEASGKAVRAALAKLLPAYMGEKKFAGKQVGDLVKSMYTVSSLACLLEDLCWMVASTQYERDYEGDDSPVPDDLREAFESMVPVFIAMATEEATELMHPAKAGKGDTMFKMFTQLSEALRKMKPEELKTLQIETASDDLEKAGKSMHEVLDSMHKAVTDHTASMADMHKAFHEKCVKAHTDHAEAMHGHIEKIRKAMGYNAEEQPTGGTEHEGKAAQAELKKKEEEEATRKAAAELVAKQLEEKGQKEVADAIRGLQKTLDEQSALVKTQGEALAKQGEELAKEKAKVEELGKTMPAHGPTVAPFLVPRPSGSATGTDLSGL